MIKVAKPAGIVTGKILEEQLSRLNGFKNTPGWQIVKNEQKNQQEENHLEVNYKFKNFAKTWDFLNQIAKEAQISKHHPTITTTYNKVNIKLTTHDVGNNITYKDLKLAQFINNYYTEITETPQRIAELDDLIKESRERLSLYQASKLIDELTALKEVEVNNANKNPVEPQSENIRR